MTSGGKRSGEARTIYTLDLKNEEAVKEFHREVARHRLEFEHEVGPYRIAHDGAPPLVWPVDLVYGAIPIEVGSIKQGAQNLVDCILERVLECVLEGMPSDRIDLYRLDGLHHRRCELVLAEAKKLRRSIRLATPEPIHGVGATPATSVPPLRFGFFLATPQLGYLVPRALTPYPGGQVPLFESKVGPPSRAYLKLWEILARLEVQTIPRPKPGETVLDLGSSPGGWTWALAQLQTRVESVDGAEIDSKVARLPNVEFTRGDAFKLSPRKVDWLFSDMICEPKRLPELIERWSAAGTERLVLSVKIKGEADPKDLASLSRLGKLRHLVQNKHELTFFSLPGLKQI